MKRIFLMGVATCLTVSSAAMAGDAANGAKLFQSKGCIACHTIDGTPRVGPTLKGIAGRKTAVLEKGVEKAIVADDAYLAKSIKEPHAQVVKGFPDAMVVPGEALKDSEIADLVAYLKTVK